MKRRLLTLVILVAGLLIAGPRAHAAIAFNQAPAACRTTSSASSFTCTFAGPIPAGATLLAWISPQNTTGAAFTVGVSDPTNGSWTSGAACFSAFNAQGNMFYFANSASVGGTLVVTFTTSTAAAAANIVMGAYTGVNTSSPFDVGPSCNTYTSSATQVGPTLVTTATTDMLVHGMLYSGNTGTISVAAPYTSRINSVVGLTDYAPGTSGSTAGPTWTIQFSGGMFIIGAALKQAGGAPVTKINPFWFSTP